MGIRGADGRSREWTCWRSRAHLNDSMRRPQPASAGLLAFRPPLQRWSGEPPEFPLVPTVISPFQRASNSNPPSGSERAQVPFRHAAQCLLGAFLPFRVADQGQRAPADTSGRSHDPQVPDSPCAAGSGGDRPRRGWCRGPCAHGGQPPANGGDRQVGGRSQGRDFARDQPRSLRPARAGVADRLRRGFVRQTRSTLDRAVHPGPARAPPGGDRGGSAGADPPASADGTRADASRRGRTRRRRATGAPTGVLPRRASSRSRARACGEGCSRSPRRRGRWRRAHATTGRP